MKRSQIGNELCLQVLSFSLWTLTFHAVKDCASTQLKELHWAREPFICTWNLLVLFLSYKQREIFKMLSDVRDKPPRLGAFRENDKA